MLKQTWQEQKSILFLSVSCGSWCCVMGVNHSHSQRKWHFADISSLSEVSTVYAYY